MRSFLYGLLIVIALVSTILVIANWNRIMAWWNGPPTLPNTSLSCEEQYEAAQAEFSKSGVACILTAADVACGSDPTFIRSTNPCIQELLEEKGWKPVNITDPGNPNPPSVNDLRISNPAGAYMYYQNDLASGGQSYGQSNVLIPFGTELQLIKFWQTNLSTQALDGYYETNYKQYGPKSGFFSMQDITKIN